MKGHRALLVDLDNTLVHSDEAYVAALAAAGLTPTSPAFAEARNRVKERLGPGNPSARNRLLYFKTMAELEAHYSPSRVLELMDRYERALADEVARQWQSLGRAVLIGRLARDFCIIVVTNENLRTQLVKLRAMDPDGELFSRVLTSEEVGFEKPHERVFAAALSLGGSAYAPGDCVMVGDNYDDDIVPALKLGMRGVLTTEFIRPKRPTQGCDVITGLDELEGLLATA